MDGIRSNWTEMDSIDHRSVSKLGGGRSSGSVKYNELNWTPCFVIVAVLFVIRASFRITEI